MNVLDLFSGIGGFSLGLERAGMRTVAFCEIEPFCQAVLKKHWPHVPIHPDVTKLTAVDVGAIDVICGGFPCQDISAAGKGVGIEGERSGLWTEYARLIGELRPRYVIVENVAMLLSRGLGTVLGDLAALGYDAEWHCIPASAVGAPHRRDRVWIVAYPGRQRGAVGGEAGHLAGAARAGQANGKQRERHGDAADNSGSVVAHAPQQPERKQTEEDHPVTSGRQAWHELGSGSEQLADAYRQPLLGAAITWPECTPWDIEPALGRVVDGVPHRLVEDELSALGNAVVPQIPEIIGRAIMMHAQPKI